MSNADRVCGQCGYVLAWHQFGEICATVPNKPVSAKSVFVAPSVTGKLQVVTIEHAKLSAIESAERELISVVECWRDDPEADPAGDAVIVDAVDALRKARDTQ